METCWYKLAVLSSEYLLSRLEPAVLCISIFSESKSLYARTENSKCDWIDALDVIINLTVIIVLQRIPQSNYIAYFKYI